MSEPLQSVVSEHGTGWNLAVDMVIIDDSTVNTDNHRHIAALDKCGLFLQMSRLGLFVCVH